MPKSKTELAKYSRDWRKKTGEEVNFNKVVRGYVETKYKDVMHECEQFYCQLVQIHPHAKNLLKTKTYKSWKRDQSTPPLQSEEITPQSEEITPQSEEITLQSEEITLQSEEITVQSEEITPQSEEITPQPSVLTQVISELNIDQLSEQVQDLIEDLQQDPDVRDLLNDQELFPPLQEDEGIDLDLEVEIDDLYNPLTEEPFW